MIKCNPHFIWRNDEEVKLFLMALDELRLGLEDYHIGWFFDQECNVIKGKFSEGMSKHMAEFIKSAINKLENNIGNQQTNAVWHKYLTCRK